MTFVYMDSVLAPLWKALTSFSISATSSGRLMLRRNPAPQLFPLQSADQKSLGPMPNEDLVQAL